jgi:hypothetical protein
MVCISDLIYTIDFHALELVYRRCLFHGFIIFAIILGGGVAMSAYQESGASCCWCAWPKRHRASVRGVTMFTSLSCCIALAYYRSGHLDDDRSRTGLCLMQRDRISLACVQNL